MSTPVLQPSLSAGEVAPALWGREDFAKLHDGAATMRNMFVSIRGGAYSRAGTALVGYSKQTGRKYPPRLITFQFSINQGICLEFGNFYMRPIVNGGYVLENDFSIVSVLATLPGAVMASASGASSASTVPGSATASYASGDTITLAGGVYNSPAVLSVNDTTLSSIALSALGTGYAARDTITLAGGVQTTPAVVQVATTYVSAATVSSGGSGGTNGVQTVTGTTGTGTKFQASVTVSGGAITAVNSITLPGSYTVDPTNIASAPVTGAGLVGAALNLTLMIGSIAIVNGGVFTTNAPGGAFTQASTSGAGTGATFTSGIFAPYDVSFAAQGSYSTFPANPVQQAATSGTGSGASFTVIWAQSNPWGVGDWIYLPSVPGVPELQGRTVVILGVNGSTYTLGDVFGNPIDLTASPPYAGGGYAARLYTLTTPWAEEDLAWIKFTQSADEMSLCCVNQTTGTEYPPYDMVRISDNNWSLAQLSTAPSVSPPASVSASASAAGWIFYQYVVTAVNPADGSESVASPVANVASAVDIAATAGSISLTWAAVAGVTEYNVYKASPGYQAAPPPGSLFGYAGSAYGTQFHDSNIIADLAQVPPLHRAPFARGLITGVKIGSQGSNVGTISYTINTLTGSGAVLVPVIVGNVLVAWIVQDGGENYAATDTIAITATAAGAGPVVAPTCFLQIGAQKGTYPAVPAYFQQRRGYFYTLNNPDTYWFSQAGSYKNFDSRIPTIDSDAITGTPWATQVNGIQFVVPMPGGLVVLTGLAAWQLSGGGRSGGALPLTPASQQAQPQAYNGCSATVPPLRIDFDIIYVQAKGAIYRDLSYNFFTNIYTGIDLTLNSAHLFLGYYITQHAYCEEPYKVIWSIRNDGLLLSDTFMKGQEINGWARHDTQGSYVSVSSVTEPPVDALYAAVQRRINGQTSYMVERFDNRLWRSVEDVWCVDAGLTIAQPTPNANLIASDNSGALTGVSNLLGGANYSVATVATVADVGGLGAGAVPTLTIVGGVITAVTFAPGQQGSAYANPQISVYDPSGAGSGFSASCVIDTSITLTADAPVFSLSNVGQVIRMNGGKAVITAMNTTAQVAASLVLPFVEGVDPLSAASGEWTMAPTVSKVGGLWHLVGATVTGTMDGAQIPPTVVGADGTITLPSPASEVIVGLPFTAQFQSVYLDAGEPTLQGRRKSISAATVRVEASRGFTVGANQLDGSAQSPPQIAPRWANMQTPTQSYVNNPAYPNAPSLFTGDVRVPVPGGWDKRGQVAVQQTAPFPLQILAVAPEVLTGDEPEQRALPHKGSK